MCCWMPCEWCAPGVQAGGMARFKAPAALQHVQQQLHSAVRTQKRGNKGSMSL